MAEEELRRELDEVKKRFEDWKSRAKIAVEKEREKFVKCAEQNEALQKRTEHLEAEILKSSTNAAPSASQSNADEQLRAVNDLLRTHSETLNSALDFAFAKNAVAAETTKQVYDQAMAAMAQAASDATSNLERHKRNVERTMKLATRDQSDSKVEVDALRAAAKTLEDEVATERNAVKQRDIAIATLEAQVEELTSSLQRFEAEEVTNANQGQHIGDLKQRLNELEREFSERELIIHDTHRDEIDRLLQRHDEEIASLRQFHEEHNTAQPYAMVGSGFIGGGIGSVESDEAYNALLLENSTLKREIDEARIAKEELRSELVSAKDKLSRFEVPPAPRSGTYVTSHNGRGHIDSSQMEPQLMRRKIYDLENQLTTATEQILNVNQELFEFKATAREREVQGHSNSPVSVDNQQQMYTKAILVKMLCAKSDEVRSSLLPVISSLVKLSNEELKAIYTANPNWIP